MGSRAVVVLGSAAVVLAAALQAGATASASRAFQTTVVPGGDIVAEPGITVDHAARQRVYVSAPRGLASGNSPAWVSTDDGRTFSRLQPTSVGPEPSNFGGGDTDVITDKANNVYTTDLWLGDDSIAFSTDHGATWTGSPVSHRPFDDRNWLGYSAHDDALYQVFDGFDGMWISRADGVSKDPARALLFKTNLPVFTWATGQNKGFNPPGRLAIDQRTGELYAVFAEGGKVLNVAHSRDRGQTWSITGLPASSAAFMLSQAVVDPAGNVAVAWSSGAKSYLSVSSDRARTFRTTRLATTGTCTFDALVALGRDHWAKAWVERDDDDSGWRIRYADIVHATRPGARVKEATVDPLVFDKRPNPVDDRSMGDFISSTVTASGTYLLTYTAVIGGKHQTRVARLEHAARAF